MKVVIVGVGQVGQELAESLVSRGHNHLVLIDNDEKRCERLAGSMDALVLCGDGSDPELLKKAQVHEADALVATTGSDAINTVIAMLGHRLGVKKIMVKLNDVWLRAACDEIGVTKIVAPKISAAADLVSALYGFDTLDLSLIVRGGLRVVEVATGGLGGKQLTEVKLPEGAEIIAVARGESVFIPRPNTKVEEDDVFLVLIENEGLVERVKTALTA